jgi:ABC-type lipoprotein export system ATPase subunit
MSEQGKFNFWKIERVIIRNFSLYTKNNKIVEVIEVINDGVYCLAGANGLGKTTFLNAINFGLTGIVLEPNKEVFSPNDIIKTNKDYTSRYFKGRISAEFKDKAEIEISLSIGDKYIKLIRGFNDREGLRYLEYFRSSNNIKNSLLDIKNLSPNELQSNYEKILTNITGIGKYEYFLFYQLYILTFDENRRMLFWDDRASNNALNIAFNENLDDTERLIQLKAKMDKYESDGRNERWQATQTKNKIEELLRDEKERSNPEYKLKQDEYFDLTNEIEKQENLYLNVEIEYDTLLKRQNIVNSEILHLRLTYRKLFSEYSEPRSKLLENHLFKIAKNNKECFVCGAEGNQVIEKIEMNLYEDCCPLCNTSINNENDEIQDQLLNKLKATDENLSKKNKNLEELILETETKKVELDSAEIKLNSFRNKLKKFLKTNSKISFTNTGNIPLDNVIEQYRFQFEEFDKKSKESYRKRDKLKPEYDNLLKKVDEGYNSAKKDFVPLFKKLAFSFIGINLNIYPKRKGRNFVLVFEMKDIARTSSHQLSESQRFFLDIALRMSLAVYLAKPHNPSTMLIDTPEGSLDIAYENRVGLMFSEFVKEYGQNIIMTANINASQLLITLAEQCGSKNMKFRRMLEWTELSEIQKEGEHLFNQVFSNIEEKLKLN